MENQTFFKLLYNLKAEHSRVLLGIKPGAQARSAWNRAVQAIVDSVDVGYQKEQVKVYFMEVRI